MTLKQQAVSGVKWSSVSAVVVTILQFSTLAILARLLSPSDFGLMGMIMVVIGFARLFADMGISKAIIYRQDATKNELSSLYWLNIFAGIAVFIIVCAVTPLVAAFYHETRLNKLIHVAVFSFLISPVGQQFQILLQKELRFDDLAKIEIGGALTNSMVAITLAFLKFGVYSLVFGQLAGAFFCVLLLFYWGWKKWRPLLHFSRQDLKGYIGFGLYQMGEKSINYFNSNLDYLLIGSLLGAESLGYYNLASNLVLRPSSMINPIVTKVVFPVFSKVQNDIDKIKRGYLKVLQLLALTNFPIMAGMAVVAPIAIPIIFGKQWMSSIILIQILAIVGSLRSIGNPVGALLLAKGRADLGFKWNAALVIPQILGLYIGAKLGGMLGIAIALVSLQIIYTIFEYFILIHAMLGPCLNEYVSSIWSSIWMSIIMGVTVFFIGIVFNYIQPQILLSIQVVIGAAIYLIMALCCQRTLILEMKEMLWRKV